MLVSFTSTMRLLLFVFFQMATGIGNNGKMCFLLIFIASKSLMLVDKQVKVYTFRVLAHKILTDFITPNSEFVHFAQFVPETILKHWVTVLGKWSFVMKMCLKTIFHAPQFLSNQL